MKKIYAYGLLLVMFIGAGLNASAYQMTFTWDIPGSVTIKTGSMSGTPVELTADQTSYTYVMPEDQAFDYVYFFANEGYALGATTMPNGTKVNAFQNATGQYLSFNFNSTNRKNWGDGKTVKIDCGKLERNDSFTFDVVNGAGSFTATFGGLGYAPELKDGENTVKYNPVYDTMPLTIKSSGDPKKLYSVTLNGTPVADRWASYDNFPGEYVINALNPGDILKVQVYEGDAPVIEECTITVDLPAGMEDCIMNVRNWSTSKFVELTDGSITLPSGTDIAFNFNAEYNFTAFTLGDKDITSSFKNNSLRFIVEKSATLKIEGAPKAYADVEFKAYVMNPEGVQLALGTFGGDTADLTGGEAIAGDITVGGYTFTPANAKVYTIKVSEKNPYIYIKAAADGKWYIPDVYDANKKSLENTRIEYAENKTFYVPALPCVNDAKLNVTVNGTADFRFKNNTALSGSWDNPDHQFSVATGSQLIDYCYAYDAPFSVSPMLQSGDFQVFLDGAPLAINNEDSGGVDGISPEKTATSPYAALTIFSGEKATAYRTTFSVAEGASASFYYSPLLHEITAKNITLLKGTEIAVKPGERCIVKYAGETIAPNADGYCIITANSAKTVSVEKSTEPIYVDITVDPATGSTMKSISTVDLYIPVFKNYGFGNDETKAITLTPENGEPITGEALNQDMNEDQTAVKLTYSFGDITAAGTYTLNVPEGMFFDATYNEATDAFDRIPGGEANSALTATYTVDPAYVSPLDVYSFTPATGVKSLDEVIISFTKAAPGAITINENTFWDYVTISNGTTEYDAVIDRSYSGEECSAFKFFFTDENEDDAIITEEGQWTLNIPAGRFAMGTQLSPAIETTFSVGAYTLTPAAGSTTSNLTKFTLAFNGAKTVVYNDTAITLEGEGFSASTTDANGVGTFTILFGSTPYTAGEYTLTIPAGAFTVDGVASEAITAKYTFKPAWVLTPAPGSTVESLDEITIEFPEADEASFNDGYITLTNGNSYASPCYEVSEVAGAAHPTFKLTMPEGAQKAPMGKLTLMIDEGSFIVNGADSPEIIVGYNLEFKASADYTLDPDGVIVKGEWGTTWAFIFEEGATVSEGANYMSKIKVTINDEELTSDQYMVMCEGNMLMMGTEWGYDPATGTLKVTAEAGAFLLNGEPAPALEGTWQIIEPKTYSYELTPDPKVEAESLSSITIVFPEASTIELFNKYGITLMQGYSFRTNPESVETSDAVSRAAEGASATIKFSNVPTAAGAYELDIREGSFTLDKAQASPAINVTYNKKSTGIEIIEINGSTEVTVFSLDGMLLLENAPAADLAKLPAGIYIVNGVKMLLGK